MLKQLARLATGNELQQAVALRLARIVGDDFGHMVKEHTKVQEHMDRSMRDYASTVARRIKKSRCEPASMYASIESQLAHSPERFTSDFLDHLSRCLRLR